MKPLKDFITRALKALTADFELNDAQAKKIINRYINAVQDEVNSKEATFFHNEMNNYVSLMNINNNSKATINKERRYMHSWFMENSPLFKVVAKGSNIKNKFTEISMYYQINTIIENMYTSTASGEDVQLEDAINNLYGEELAQIIFKGEEELYDIVKIDLESLKSFIDTTNTYIDTNKKMYRDTTKLEYRVREAKRIYTLASVCKGHLLQIKNNSEFGRRFYKGPNLQSVHKDVRHAALGECIEYDINNSVYAWRLNEAQKIVKQYEDDTTFPATIDYMDRKEAIRLQIARDVFKERNWDEPYKVKQIKHVFTAIGFGAQGSANPSFWSNENGLQQTYAINSIITNPVERELFLTDPFVKEFMNEQFVISKIIFAMYKKKYKDLEIVKNSAGNLSEPKLLAYLYQHVETALLDDALSHVPKDDILLRCHDAFYVRHISVDDILEVKSKIAQYIPEMTMEKIEINKWVTVDPRFAREIQESNAEHKRIIAREMEKAKNYVPKTFVNVTELKPPKTPDEIIQERKDERDREILELEEQIAKKEESRKIMAEFIKSRKKDDPDD